MMPVPFVKYTSCGNNFVIIDDLQGPGLSEAEMSRFAFQATNPYFGVGCDNLLVIQASAPSTLAAVNRARGYWHEAPRAEQADFLFRMFEPNGDEALCCGNGLMSVAEYLHRHYRVEAARIMTEVPLARPRVLRLGHDAGRARSWVDLGAPRPTPAALVDRGAVRPVAATGASLERVDDVEIRLRAHDLEPFTRATSFRLGGYLVFTGEPHLVVFPDREFSVDDLAGTIFSSSVPHVTDTSTSGVCQRVNFGTSLLRRIGAYLNRRAGHLFPAGINVNLARVDRRRGVVEYRCYERGIHRETLACGTGALAVAYAARVLGLLDSESIEVWPHRCRWYEPHAKLRVRHEGGPSWVLETTPRMLCTGSFVDQGFRHAEPVRADEPAHGEEAIRAEVDDAAAAALAAAS